MNPILFNYTMNGVPLNFKSIKSEASRMSGLVKRTLGIGWHSSPRTKHIMYCSLVRHLLEYCTPSWSGTSRKNIKSTEKNQL